MYFECIFSFSIIDNNIVRCSHPLPSQPPWSSSHQSTASQHYDVACTAMCTAQYTVAEQCLDRVVVANTLPPLSTAWLDSMRAVCRVEATLCTAARAVVKSNDVSAVFHCFFVCIFYFISVIVLFFLQCFRFSCTDWLLCCTTHIDLMSQVSFNCHNCFVFLTFFLFLLHLFIIWNYVCSVEEYWFCFDNWSYIRF